MFFEPFELGFEGFAKFPEIGHPIQQTVMPLAIVTENSYKPLGTGFVISPNGLMMTAAHVIKEGLKYGLLKSKKGEEYEYELRFFAVFFTKISGNNEFEESEIGGLIPIKKAWYSPITDVGFCWLNSPIINGKRLTYPVTQLSPRIPKIGEHIGSIGYYEMEGVLGEEINGIKEATHIFSTSTSTGEVTEVFREKRDSSMLNYPCFQTNARFEPGMSGGPIFCESGGVCGVVCSGFTELEEEGDFLSFGTMIWPSLGTYITGKNAETKKIEQIMIYDLIKKGHIVCDSSISHIKVETLENGDREVWIHTP